MQFVTVTKQQACDACVGALYIPSILWGTESGDGDFAPQQAWALHTEKVEAPHQAAQPTDDITLCQEVAG